MPCVQTRKKADKKLGMRARALLGLLGHLAEKGFEMSNLSSESERKVFD